jgi:serine/threonine-protein kinase
MGVVVAATHVELDQQVAIKFLLPEAMRHPEVVERFLREAKVAAKVKSEHVARVSDVGKVERDGGEDVPFIVMEYLEGSDLGAMIDAGGRLPLDEACELGLQACEALAEVHAAGIIHRDLKPSNLFVTRRSDGSPCLKLLDFGISKFTVHPDDESGDPALTATATIMGSPSYMSPEQLRSTKEVDARTDVWALGAVLYEAMTGKPAFRGETVPQVCFMIGAEDPAPPSSLRADIPEDLERALLSALDKKAETRATLVDLARAMVTLAPPRGRASLDRVEAVMGASPTRPKEASIPLAPSKPVEVARTQASWGDEPKRKRGGEGRWSSSPWSRRASSVSASTRGGSTSSRCVARRRAPQASSAPSSQAPPRQWSRPSRRFFPSRTSTCPPDRPAARPPTRRTTALLTRRRPRPAQAPLYRRVTRCLRTLTRSPRRNTT